MQTSQVFAQQATYSTVDAIVEIGMYLGNDRIRAVNLCHF